MTAEYSAFGRPNFTADDFAREEIESDTPMFATPIYAQRTTTRRSGVNPAVWVAVPAIVLAVGAGAYFMSQRSEPTVAATRPMAVVPAAPADSAANTVQPVNPPVTATPTTPMAEAAPARLAPDTTPVRTARAKPAPRPVARSAAASGADAGATVPSAPMPYSGTAQTSAPSPAPVIAPPAPAVTAEPANPTPVMPEASTPPVAPQVPDAPTPPPNA